MPELLPALTSGQGGCLCCPPKPIELPLDAEPHPGFGGLTLTCDGETPDWWWEFCDWPTKPYYVEPEWVTGTVKVGPRKGEPWGFWSETEFYWSLAETVTVSDIEQCVLLDPDHDWRLSINGAMSDYTYQRQDCGKWVLVEKGMGFA